MLPGVPHILIPAIVYNLLVCGLIAAASWHLVAVLQTVRAHIRSDS